jgi:hypothetical protein
MKDKARKPTTSLGSEPPPSEGLELPERWSVQRKTELVLRLLRGEALDAVSRESQVPYVGEPECWGKERVPSTFLDTNNCKDPKYR